MSLVRKRCGRRRNAGFSLIELLIVIAIILIILAVALPKLTSARRFAQEMAAKQAMRTINTAQTQYYSQFGQYAVSLVQLGPPSGGNPGPNGADLIDRELAAGQKGNFRFTLTQTQTGYSVTSVPTAFGTSGTHTYYTDQSQGIHEHTGQELATPNDPMIGEATNQQQSGDQSAPAPAPAK
jgi:prepilin-type N-terminal cleavage/methylation domain-containing protein